MEIDEAVRQLIEYIDHDNMGPEYPLKKKDHFELGQVNVQKGDVRSDGYDWKISARDVNNKPFIYAMYLEGTRSEMDGY